MAMQVNGNCNHFGTDYAEMVKEKQAAQGAEKATEAAKAVEEKGSKPSGQQDEYISSEKSGKEPTGLYQVSRDENGKRKIFFDDPKAAHGDGKKDRKADKDDFGKGVDGKGPKMGGNGQGKPAEICVGNTDKVDREIKNLKEKEQELKQQIRSASGDEKKIRELEKKLAQVEQELSRKDNDTYRKQHSGFTEK